MQNKGCEAHGPNTDPAAYIWLQCRVPCCAYVHTRTSSRENDTPELRIGLPCERWAVSRQTLSASLTNSRSLQGEVPVFHTRLFTCLTTCRGAQLAHVTAGSWRCTPCAGTARRPASLVRTRLARQPLTNSRGGWRARSSCPTPPAAAAAAAPHEPRARAHVSTRRALRCARLHINTLAHTQVLPALEARLMRHLTRKMQACDATHAAHAQNATRARTAQELKQLCFGRSMIASSILFHKYLFIPINIYSVP